MKDIEELITIDKQAFDYEPSHEKRMLSLLSDVITFTIEKLCFSFCVNSTAMYDMLYETYDLRMDLQGKSNEMDDSDTYNRNNFVNSSYKRLKGVMKRFIDMENGTKLYGLTLSQERVYDSIMYQEMVRLYLWSTRLFFDIGRYEKWHEEEWNPVRVTYDIKDWGGYTRRSNREEEYTFFEVILYCSILCSTQKSSINTINKELKRKRERERAEKWFFNFSKALFSDDLKNALIRTAVDITYKNIQERFDKVHEYLRLSGALVEDKEKGKGYYKPADIECEDPEVEKNWYVINRYEDLSTILVVAELIATEVLHVRFPMEKEKTTAESFWDYFDKAITLSKKEKTFMKKQIEWNYITEEDYEYASIMAAFFKRFVDDAIQSTANLLECLPESVVTGEDIYKYLYGND